MVFTFYSYKGGVGRTMALANVARWLALQGLRVVMIDWDLEAPGLESFFFGGSKLEEVRDQIGLIDLLVSYRRLFPRIRDTLAKAGDQLDDKVAALEGVLPPVAPSLQRLQGMGSPTGEGGALYLLSAGWRAGDKFAAYAQAVQEFNWDGFYREYQGEAYFEWMRRQLLAPDLADVVFIDSRTGVTEMGGVCTRQLADVVVIFSAPNLQNLEGIMSMARDVTRPDLAVRRGRPVRIVMVPSRVDNTSPARVNTFMERFVAEGQPFTPDVFRTLKSTFWTLRVPYAPTYAYQERMAIGESDADRDLEESYKRLAVHMAMLAAPQNPIRRRLSAEIERVFGKLLPTVFVAYAAEDRELATEVRHRLEEANISVWPDLQESLAAGASWPQAIASILEQTRFVVVVATPESFRSPWIRQEWQRARELGVLVIPVAPSPQPALGEVPGWMRQVSVASLDRDWSRVVSALSAPNTTSRVPMMAPEVSEVFVSRDGAMQRLSSLLLGGSVGRVALYGLPGCGKTSLAAAFCRSDEALSAFLDGVVWVSAAENADPKSELERVYTALTGEHVAFADLRHAHAQIEARLSSKQCLFVLDDSWSPETVAAYPLEIKGCRYLVTTSDRAVAARAEAVPIELGTLSEAEARDVLRRTLPEADQGLALENLGEFSTRVGTFPQALRLAAAGLAAVGSVTGAVDAPLGTEILKTFEREVLGRLDDGERQRLVLLAFATGEAAVPLTEVHLLWSTDPESATRTVTRFADLSLLTGDPGSDGVCIHPWARNLIAKRYPERDVGKVLEASYARLEAAEQESARQVLCRLVRVTETPDGIVNVEPQPAPVAAFGAAQRAVVQRLTAMNVVVVRHAGGTSLLAFTEQSSVYQWPRLREWIKADQPFLLWRQRLAGYVADWHRTKDAGALLSGKLLDEAQRWARTRRNELSDEEFAYIERSEHARVPPSSQALPSRAGGGRWVALVAVVLVAVALVVAGVAYVMLTRRASSTQLTAPVVGGAPKAEELVLQGDLLAERGDLTGAVGEYSSALAVGGENAAIYFKRGSAYCRTGKDLDKCIQDLDRAHELDPKRTDVLTARATARLQKDDLDGALRDLDAAIEIDPKNATAHVSRAEVLERANRMDEALKEYSAALALDSSLSGAWFGRARLYEATGDSARAVADLKRVVELNADPTSVRAAQARLTRLGAPQAVRPLVTVYLHYVAPQDRPIMEKLRDAIVKQGLVVASIQLVEGRTYGDVRFLPQDAAIASSISTLVESTLADAGYAVPIERIPLQQLGAKPGRIEVWIPALSLPPQRQQRPRK